VRPLLPREQVLLGGLGLLVLVAAFSLFIYVPQTDEAATLTRRLAAQRADVAPLQKEVQRKQELEREIAELQSAVQTLDAKLPSTREIPQLLLQLDQLAHQTGVTVTSLKPGIPESVAVPQASSPLPPRIRGGSATPAPQVSKSTAPKVSQPDILNYQKFAIALETKGTFSATLKFVHGLESFPRFLAISDMRVTQASSPSMREDNPEDPVLSLGLTATAYARPESGDVP
jgi:Tfp pilus assembly protein PilO